MSKEEVKEEVEKVAEEVEEVSKKEAEEVPEEVQAVVEEVEQKVNKFTNIVKLKCGYKTYKEERTKLKMPVTKKCAKCGKDFVDKDELYIANKEKDKTGKNYLICENCIKII